MKRKSLLIGFMFHIFFFSCLAQLPLYVQAEEYAHPGDYDIPKFVDHLKGVTIRWRIVNASGIFADEDMQPNDIIQYEVKDVDYDEKQYKVEISKKGWGENEFKKQGNNDNASYYLIQRDWGQASADFFLPQHHEYWGSMGKIDNEFEALYQTEWWNWKMLNTVTITYNMNETNYDHAKYARAEGILLERKTVVNINEGKTRGYLYIVLESYSGFLELSPWFYIIVISIIIGLIAIVVIIISLLIQRRKRIYREIDEI
ncbi:MAG: hypothetical protein ACTSR8_01150 [Promethearchaeota archaeon]